MWSRLYQHKQVPIPLNAPTTITCTRELDSGHIGFISTVKYTLTRLTLVVVTALYQPRKTSVQYMSSDDTITMKKQVWLWFVAWQKKDINNGFWLLVICPADLLPVLLVIHLITISTLGLTIGCATFKTFPHRHIGLSKLQQMQI